jgi:predicted DNA-binding ribbon-helix-helix protein
MTSPGVKRSIVIAGHKTSVSLEDAFWKALKEIARERGIALCDLVTEIDSTRRRGSLSSAIRVFVLDHYRRGSGSVSKAVGTDGRSGMRAAASVLRAD